MAPTCPTLRTCCAAPESTCATSKLRPGVTVNEIALRALVEAAYADIKSRVEHG